MADPKDLPRGTLDVFAPTRWAEDGTAAQPSDARLDSGRDAGETLPAAEFNWMLRNLARFCAALLARVPLASSGLYGSWVERNGVWINGTNNLEGRLSDGSTTKVADVWVDTDGTGAVRMQVQATPADPVLLTASKTHYVHVPKSSATAGLVLADELDIEVVNLNAPSAGTPADHATIWKINTNGTGITSSTILVPTTPLLLDVAAETLEVLGELELNSDLTMNGGDLTGVNEASITTLVVGAGGIESTDGPNLFATVTADTLVATGLFTADGDVGTVTIEGPLTVDTDMDVTGALSAFNGLTVDGSQLSVTGVGSSINFAAHLTMASGSDIIGSAGSELTNFSRVAASVLDTTSSGEARIFNLVFYQDASLSTASGALAWNGYKLALGDGVGARTLAIPRRSYVASVSTASSIDDTGAEVTVDMLTGQSVDVVYESEVTNDNTGLNVALRLTANGTNIGGTQSRRVTATEYVSFRRRVLYTAASDGSVTFKARHGANLGTTTSINVMLTVTRA
jgi:hypothetical protein